VRLAASALALTVAFGVVTSVLAEPLKPAIEREVRAATFEVVIPKIDEGKTVEYERPLPWDLLPFTIRNDRYLSIGTAFAIGRNEYLTAAHVFMSWVGSGFGEPLLRTTDGKVHAIDRVLKFSGHEDFILFSLRDPPGVKPLAIETRPQINSEVQAVGNALGEGVVIRSGLLTSETLEQQDGRWRWYRFSAAASPGNSGGPLVNSAGRVIGVILAASPSENLNIALPIRQVLEAPDRRARMDARVPYQLPIMPFAVQETFKFDFELPMGVADFGTRLVGELNAHSDRLRAKLLSENAERLFPRGPQSVRMMHTGNRAWQPRLIGYASDGEWQPREIAGEIEASLPHGGQVTAGAVANTALVQVKKPENLALAGLFADSKLQMDLALKALNWSRFIGPEAIQLTSLGPATQDERHVDAYGRTWQLRGWPFAEVGMKAVALVLPVPNGYVALMRMSPSAHAHASAEELKILANLIYLRYDGTLPQWNEFADLGDLRPKVFDSIRIDYTPNRTFKYRSKRFEIGLDAGFIDITDRSSLELGFTYFPERDAVVWDVSEFSFQESQDRTFQVSVRRAARVPAELGGDLYRQWGRMMRREAPFNGMPYLDQKYPRVRTVFGMPQLAAGTTAGEPAQLYEVGVTTDGYLSRESAHEIQQELVAGFKLLE
jgi:serine protease Do